MGRATAPVRQVEELRDLLHAWLPRLRERYGVQSLGLFGSYVRKQQTAGSDLDVLVEFEKTPGLLTFLKIEHELSDALDLRVDLSCAPPSSWQLLSTYWLRLFRYEAA